jgi:phosphatidate cytidylyltransferase
MMLSQLGIIMMLAATFLCDSAAYFVGSLWGRHHYSSISPNKTIEGSIGGLVAAVLTCSVGWYFLAAPAYPLGLGVVMGLLVGLFAQGGDLLVSLMKRYFRVKDASDLIPGHGGVLDRFGSLFFVAPILSLYFIIIAAWTAR